MSPSSENNKDLIFQWDYEYTKKLRSDIEAKNKSVPIVERNLQEYFDFLDNVLPKYPLPPRKLCTTTKVFEL
ncbi:MAG: hypothetical protein GX639_15955 [Fibrobacter sp.]|nr:hypothetical protein [Fibrobacter sp.]